MAEALKEELNVNVALISGKRGEFTVRVGPAIVIDKTDDDFPSPTDCVEAVRNHLDS